MPTPRGQSFRLVIALLAACGAIACSAAPAPPQKGVILISIDTLRSDTLGAYGHAGPTSPTIDALAAEGALFEQAISTSPWTLPAHASMVTGLYPSHHGAISDTRAIDPAAPVLAEAFQNAGYRTGAVVNSHYLTERYGFPRGFDDYEYIEEEDEARESDPIFDRAIDWLKKGDERPFFLFLHDYHVHSSYRSLPEYEELFTKSRSLNANATTRELHKVRQGSRGYTPDELEHIRALYAAGVRQTDAELGRFIAFLEQEKVLEDVLLVITSDHGEEFLEHGGTLHGRTQYEELIRIPLVMRGPGVPRGARIETPVSIVDLPATLLALRGLSWNAPTDGVDLSSPWRNEASETAERVIFSQADHIDTIRPDVIRSARLGHHKLIHDRRTDKTSLFDLREDPGELRDISAERPEVVSALERAFEALHRENPPGARLPPLEESERKHLEALGYIQ